MKLTRNILIIDPDMSWAKSMKEALTEEGFKVIFAGSQDEGAMRLIESMPDLVILNLKPAGEPVLNSIRQILESHPLARVIVVGAECDAPSALEYMRQGASDYLARTESSGSLLASIKRIQERDCTLCINLEPDTTCVAKEDKTLVFGNDLKSIPYIINQAVLNAAMVCPRIEMLKMALSEIVLNAVEHGNLNITMEEKVEGIHKGIYSDLIEQRKQDPRYGFRIVTLDVHMDRDALVYYVTDEGNGFDYSKGFNPDPRAHIGSGLGLEMARNFFSEVTYVGRGNRVKLVYIHHKGDDAENRIPHHDDMADTIKQREELERLFIEMAETKDLMEEQAAKLTIALAEMEEMNDIIQAQNARMTNELEMAGRLQKSLLPDTYENINGVSFSCKYIPSIHIGGDLYDVVDLDNGHTGFIIADVSGHGVAAALISSMFKMSFHALAATVASPKILMHMLNEELKPVLNEEYITAFYVLVDRHEKTITYSNAGHPSPLLFKKRTGEIQELDTDGFFLGSFADGGYEEKTECSIEQGDALLLYTDCIIETENDSGELYGKNRLMERFAKAIQKSRGQEVIDAIEEDIRAFNVKDTLDDDFTVMLLEFWEEAGAAKDDDTIAQKITCGGFVEF